METALDAEAELALAQGELTRAARCIEQLLGKYEELQLRHFKPGILFHTLIDASDVENNSAHLAEALHAPQPSEVDVGLNTYGMRMSAAA